MKINIKINKMLQKVKLHGIRGVTEICLEKRKMKKALLAEIQASHLKDSYVLHKQRKEECEFNPDVTIITPVYNTPKKFLKQLINSVKMQTYCNWEWCIADGSDSEHKYVQDIFARISRKDKRIIYKKLNHNLGIVGNTNKCIEMASNRFIALLDHDDFLHPSALYEVAKQIRLGADFIYTDEMKFSKSIKKSVDIICKNQFSKDELRSHNYICHLVVFDKFLLDEMQCIYREKCEGSQDYDMVLRLTEKAKNIIHIPQILYYWRVHPGSVAMDLSVKQYAVEAAKTAIADQLVRVGERGRVYCNLPYQTIYRINYPIKKQNIVTILLWGEYNHTEVQRCILNLEEKTHYRPLEIVVASNIQVEIKSELNVVFENVTPEDTMYSWFNKAETVSNGKYIICLNEKCLPYDYEWIENLLIFVQREDVCVAGPLISYIDNKIYSGGGVLDKDEFAGIHIINFDIDNSEQGYEANMRYVRNTTILPSVCMMVSREKWKALGGFDLKMSDCCDADFCLRGIEMNCWNVWSCFAQMYYVGTESIYDFWSEPDNFRNTWKSLIEMGDGFYNPLIKKLRKM